MLDALWEGLNRRWTSQPLLNENTKTASEAKEHPRAITKHKFKLSEEEKIIRLLLVA